MPAEQSADASGPTWNWRLPRALPVTSPASCHGGASRAKYPTEPSQNSWRMTAQPAVAPGFPRHPGQCAWPPGAGRPHPFGPLPSPGSYGLRGAAGSGGSCGFGICANLRNSSPPPETVPAPRARYGGIPTKPGPPPRVVGVPSCADSPRPSKSGTAARPDNRIYVIWFPGFRPAGATRPLQTTCRPSKRRLLLPLWSSSRDKLYFNLLTQHLLQGPRYAPVEPL